MTLQAWISFAATLAGASASPLFARAFDPSTPERAARPYYASAALICAGIAVVHGQLWPLAWRGVQSGTSDAMDIQVGTLMR